MVESAQPRGANAALQAPPPARRLARAGAQVPYSYDAHAWHWRPGPRAAGISPRRLKAVTWNIWFGEAHWQDRLDALLGTVAWLGPDVVGLQEVTPHQLGRVLDNPWVRSHFSVSDVTGETLRPHGVLLLSRYPVRDLELIALPSERDRKLLVARVETALGALTLGVTHLESGRGQTEKRHEQLEVIRRRLAGRGPALLMGDLNFDADRDPERWLLAPEMIDCWRAVHPHEPGLTMDDDENAMRASLGKSSGSMRCDCVLLTAAQGAWQPERMWRLGLEPIPGSQGALYPSDHFGLAATLTARSSPASRAR